MDHLANGAPGTIRTSDPQIRSLMLYPAELRARFSLVTSGQKKPAPDFSEPVRKKPAKERFSYRLPPRLARSANGTSVGSSFGARASAKPKSFTISSRFRPSSRSDALECRRSRGPRLRPRALVANTEQLDRAVRNHDPERRADRSFDQMDLAVMGTHQFGRDREPQPAAARPA